MWKHVFLMSLKVDNKFLVKNLEVKVNNSKASAAENNTIGKLRSQLKS